jgi:hypothetical protein
VEAGRRKPTTVIEAKFELDENDAKAITDVFGEKALTSRGLSLSRGYANRLAYGLHLDNEAARNHLAESANLPDTLRKQLGTARDWTAFGAVLAAAEETAEVVRLRELLGKFSGQEASRYAFNGILNSNSRIPKFPNFFEYHQITGHDNIPALITLSGGCARSPESRRKAHFPARDGIGQLTRRLCECERENAAADDQVARIRGILHSFLVGSGGR